MRKSMKGWGAIASVMLMTLTAPRAVAQQKWTWPDSPENLQVLPSDWTGQRLRPVMVGFTRALGVRCSHCHVGEEGQPLSTYDFPSDDNPNKDRARTMLRMLGEINETLEMMETSGTERVNIWCHTCHRGRPRPLTLAEELEEVYRAEDVEAALDRYRDLRERFYGRGSYDFGENSLNEFGYAVLSDGRAQDAIEVFQLNVELFPDSANVYDSLGEAYLHADRRLLALENYEKSLELNPRNKNAQNQIKMLRDDNAP